MSASIGAMNVELLIMKAVNTKLCVVSNESKIHFIVNPKFKLRSTKIKWEGIKLLLKILFVYLIWRLCYLFSNWKRNRNMVELDVQVILLCAVTVGISCLDIWDKSCIKFQFVMNNCWERLGVKIGWPNANRPPQLRELVIYCMVLSLLSFPGIAIGYPLVGNFDPIQYFAHLCFPQFLKTNPILSLVLKVVASISYGCFAFLVALHVLCLLLGATCFVEAVTKFSHDVLPSKHTTQKICKPTLDPAIRQEFQGCYILYRQLRILTEAGGKGIQNFLQTLLAMGVPMGSFTVFCMIKLYDEMNMFVWLVNLAHLVKYKEITASTIRIVEITTSAGPIPPLHRLANDTDSVQLEELSNYQDETTTIGGGDEEPPDKGEDSEAQTALEKGPHREKWGSKLSYLLTLIGFAVGFGNIWRFPYVFSNNGGLAYLIPYYFALAFIGIPMFFLELSIGQRLRKKMISAWHEISPSFGGIGISCGWLCFIISLYYNVLVAYCFVYWMDSFKSPLPWADCSSAATASAPSPSEIPSYLQECQEIGGHSAMFYMNRGVFQISSSITTPGRYSLRLMSFLLLTWLIIFLVLFKGVKMLGKVVYFTSLFPYVCILTFLIVVSFQEGAFFGAWRLVQPDWPHLLEPIAWLKGGSQIFFSLGLAQGSLVVFASFNHERNNCHKDSIWISIINSATSMFMASVTFPFIGSMGYRKYKECIDGLHNISSNSLTPDFNLHSDSWTLDNSYDIFWMRNSGENFHSFDPSSGEGVQLMYGIGTPSHGHSGEETTSLKELVAKVDNVILNSVPRNCSIRMEAMKSGSGTGLVFVAYGEAVLNLPYPNIWAFLIFTMLLSLGLGTGFGNTEGAVAALMDYTKWSRLRCCSVVCGFSALISISLFPFGWGNYVLDLLDQYTANWTLLAIALVECICVAWIYGLGRIAYDVKLMTGSKPNYFILFSWKYSCPIILSLMLIGSVCQFVYKGIKDCGLTYGTFNPGLEEGNSHPHQHYPAHIILVGFGLLVFCMFWIPLVAILRCFNKNLIEDSAPAVFPEEELRKERNIEVEKEEDQFDEVERIIIGKGGLGELQMLRDKNTNAGSLAPGGGGGKTMSENGVNNAGETEVVKVEGVGEKLKASSQWVVRKEDRTKLRACPRIAYCIGPLRYVRESTAFAIAETIVSWTVTAALIKDNSV
ncbi:unnamed protein product [Orchesella dallaii]|uniref:Transporter n=1 Tax=Orchesella dallaii TaxID=48710 RepID=A0ABP1RJQ9_9HEXA